MSRWFRHYAGMMRDDKLVRVAIKSKQPVERVLWVWGAILESAAELNTDGRFVIDPAEVARFLGVDVKQIRAIIRHLDAASHTNDGAVVRWGKRQFKSDRSNERVVRHRAKLADVVTLQSRYGNAPETETETETDTLTYPRKECLGEVERVREGSPFRVMDGGAK